MFKLRCEIVNLDESSSALKFQRDQKACSLSQRDKIKVAKLLFKNIVTFLKIYFGDIGSRFYQLNSLVIKADIPEKP